MIKIGVLALQGGFAKHIQMFKQMGVSVKEVRTQIELDSCSGLVIPGGESTCMFRQLEFSGLGKKIAAFGEKKPIWGTCAGLILMSKDLSSPSIKSFDFLDIKVERNAYGRQKDSFSDWVEICLDSLAPQEFNGVFIRAPQIYAWNPNTVKVLSYYEEKPILVREGKHLGSTFHPELTDNPLIHKYFLSMVEAINHSEAGS